MSNSTGLHCTNCNREFEEFEDVTVIHGGFIAPLFGEYHIIDSGPDYWTLCKKCAALLVEPRPNRVVVELGTDLRDGDAIKAIRAERPDDLCIIVRDYVGAVIYGTADSKLLIRRPIDKLNTVKEEA